MQQTDQQEQEELQALQEELQTLRQQREREREEQGQQDQEVLTLLTHQAEQAEESARQLTVKLQEKVSIQRYHRCFSAKRMIRRSLCGLSCMQMSFLTCCCVLSDGRV